MFDAMEIARHLIRVGYDPNNPDESVLLCPLRLQKLLYYCQGWSLALLGRPLFSQPIEAWTYGPVVRDVYDRFQGARDGITPKEAGEPTTHLSRTESALLEMVWCEYACKSPGRLIEMTHTERPWLEARGGLPPDAHSSVRLSVATMADFFQEQGKLMAVRRWPAGYPLIDLADEWRAEEEMERTGGVGTPAADVFGPLLAEARG